jgi:hypothetical protein
MQASNRASGLAAILGMMVVTAGCREQEEPVIQPRILAESTSACTLDDLRRVFHVGAKAVYVQERGDSAPETTHWTVTSADEEGFECQLTMDRRSGTFTDTVWRAWQTELAERTYAPGTAVTEEVVVVPAGRFLCEVYRSETKLGESVLTKRTCYAKERPGLRVAHETHYAPGDVTVRLRLVSWRAGPG